MDRGRSLRGVNPPGGGTPFQKVGGVQPCHKTPRERATNLVNPAGRASK